MKYLQYFSTDASYQAGRNLLSPWLSYCEETDKCEYNMQYLSSYVYDSSSGTNTNDRILRLFSYLRGVDLRKNNVMIFYNNTNKGQYNPKTNVSHSGTQSYDNYDRSASVSGEGTYNGYSLFIHEYEDYNGNSTYSQQRISFSLGTTFYEIKKISES